MKLPPKVLALAAMLFGMVASTQAESAPSDRGCPRMVSQAPYITETLAWLDLKECLVGVSRYDELDLPRTGGLLDPDAEALALLAPELWFASNWADEKTIAAATPPGTAAFRLGGFGSMAEVEENLRLIGAAAGLADAEAKAAAFARDWRERAAALDGNQTRVLLLSACSGTPYSYGRKTLLFDLFTNAGFKVVESEEKIRHLTPQAPIPDLPTLLEHFHPELVFVFENRTAEQCRLLTTSFPVQVVALDNALFMHASPTLLEGLDALAASQSMWADR